MFHFFLASILGLILSTGGGIFTAQAAAQSQPGKNDIVVQPVDRDGKPVGSPIKIDGKTLGDKIERKIERIEKTGPNTFSVEKKSTK